MVLCVAVGWIARNCRLRGSFNFEMDSFETGTSGEQPPETALNSQARSQPDLQPIQSLT
jgi:hypothetical protein